ncbi:Acg family FMN-binding oxidoreductase [Nocardioides aurantiacus]|uniref:Nitroreductase family protein n=1 Tax=Nocardioides aurantiacus TaxID=86796 RepID=A0A3N2CTH7_9ACTN|nr:NAD(P)H nitroreductase [Nocardioides aurantiacus]ROR90842.1 hypothetical protein EDD33_1690 [Nocardioides aurantiacus]
MSPPTSSVTHELVRTACLAPSVHNSQPWSWRIPAPDVVELYADRSRQLADTDPLGRELRLSCGAALHHLTVAARAFGFEPHVEVVLEADRSTDLLARTSLVPAQATETDVTLLAALENRVTDRRAFTDWEVPLPRLVHLADETTPWGAHARVLHETGEVQRTEALLEEARRGLLTDTTLGAEQQAWLDRGPHDGVPSDSARPRQRDADPARPTRFDRWTVPPHASSPGGAPEPEQGRLLGVYTAADDPLAWLRSGMALSAVWLEATRQGLAVAPQTHALEQPRLRSQLRHDVFDDLGWPQVVLRVGWPQSRHHLLPHTPRRPLSEVVRA